MLLHMAAPKKPTKRSIAAKALYEKRKVGRLHSIASRRAKSEGMTKKEYIEGIMKGKYRPITPDDIANEPDAEEGDAPEAPQLKASKADAKTSEAEAPDAEASDADEDESSDDEADEPARAEKA